MYVGETIDHLILHCCIGFHVVSSWCELGVAVA